MTCGIYKIENNLNHKIYIGQSKNIEARWRKHRSADDNYSIHKAFRKYGIENFSFDVIEETSPDQLDEREVYWISYYHSYEEGYNETIGGQGTSGLSVNLSFEQIEEITKLLLTNQYSNIELAERFSVSENTICGINTGYYWKRDGIDYPIAKERARTKVKKQKFCIDCGSPIDSNAVRCVGCSNKARRIVERPSKEELFLFLKNHNGNFSLAGRQYGVSDASVRKWCKGYNLPYRSRDYKEVREAKKVEIAERIQYAVQQIHPKTGEVIATYDSLTSAQKETGIHHIYEASDEHNTSRKSAGGYIWKRIKQ